jgi:hypothetical protein
MFRMEAEVGGGEKFYDLEAKGEDLPKKGSIWLALRKEFLSLHFPSEGDGTMACCTAWQDWGITLVFLPHFTLPRAQHMVAH